MVPDTVAPLVGAVIETLGGVVSAAVTMVESVAVLLDKLVSPAVETLAVLITLGTAAAATPTVRLKLVLPPADTGPAEKQVTVCPEARKLQPVPEPETKLKPVGSVSVTVMVPVVAPEPTFCRVSV